MGNFIQEEPKKQPKKKAAPLPPAEEPEPEPVIIEQETVVLPERPKITEPYSVVGVPSESAGHYRVAGIAKTISDNPSYTVVIPQDTRTIFVVLDIKRPGPAILCASYDGKAIPVQGQNDIVDIDLGKGNERYSYVLFRVPEGISGEFHVLYIYTGERTTSVLKCTGKSIPLSIEIL
jgi:hypothetical protein